MPPLLRPLGSLRTTQVQGAMQLRALAGPAAPALQLQRRPALGLPRARRHQRTQAFFGKLFGGSGTDQDVSGPAEEKQHPAAAADGAASAPRFQTLLCASLVPAAGGAGLRSRCHRGAAGTHGAAAVQFLPLKSQRKICSRL